MGVIINDWEITREIYAKKIISIYKAQKKIERKFVESNVIKFDIFGNKWNKMAIELFFDKMIEISAKNFNFIPEPLEIYKDSNRLALFYYPIFKGDRLSIYDNFKKYKITLNENLKKLLYNLEMLEKEGVFIQELAINNVLKSENTIYLTNLYALKKRNDYDGYDPNKLSLINETYSAPELFSANFNKSNIDFSKIHVYLVGKLVFQIFDINTFKTLFFKNSFPSKVDYEGVIANNPKIPKEYKEFLLKSLAPQPAMRFLGVREQIVYLKDILNVKSFVSNSGSNYNYNPFEKLEVIKISYTPPTAISNRGKSFQWYKIDSFLINIGKISLKYFLGSEINPDFAEQRRLAGYIVIDLGNGALDSILNNELSGKLTTKKAVCFITSVSNLENRNDLKDDYKKMVSFLSSILPKVEKVVLISPNNPFLGDNRVEFKDLKEYLKEKTFQF